MMKASVYNQYGAPDVLHFENLPIPIPKANEILVRVYATTVNRTDCGFRKSEYLITRLFSGIFKPHLRVLGNEFSGMVEKVGAQVKSYKKGDRIFGLNTMKFGTHAEFVCLKETGSFTTMLDHATFAEAAAVCDGMMLASNFMKKIDFKKQKHILVNGASGSIGTAALQLAKYYGANVTAVCKTERIELVKSLGADKVIDYKKEDFTKGNEQYDVILDSVGKSTFFKCKKILKPGGIYISSELGPYWQNIWLALITPILGGKKVLFPIPTDSKEQTELYKEILATGKYTAVIDKVYPFEKIKEATEYVETGEKTGNVVIEIFRI
jgi:NADPH:quinone reductase-like Zn-dependent oxidoreductase